MLARAALTPGVGDAGRVGVLKRLFERGSIDRAMFPVFGPAQVTAYVDGSPDAVPRDDACPRCGRLVSEHEVDRTAGRSSLRCP